ncbi:MCD, Malonyl-CoA decarboxylase MCD [Aurantimonas aggregata]|uniref:MCD, Malonyl-CoA decarboxylase MCD n=1 Tax=Aurantimonas aggregata TaxID=2047720 RepID=A0A6L9MGS4_9HYPH|nr:malonyl-CoA decarboxylase [Aurantimonas aggregata]NDV86858.1 MCD, Malonyl-CoA decarboxylase MCD [Aurantimonas aggregata]
MSRVSLLSDLLSSIGARSWFLGDDATRRIALPELAGLCHRLVSSRGEASGVRLAADILKGVRALDDAEAERLFAILAEEFGPDEAALRDAAEAFASSPGPATLSTLQRIAEPPRQELFRRLNLAPGGTAEIVRLRERLLPFLRRDRERLGPVEDDLRHLFQSWFNRGFLLMRPIDWNTPASILEKIIRYEAVHAIATWEELRQRLAPADRRCFAFFHPSIPDDPLIFVEVALTAEIPASIASVLDPARPVLAPDAAQTAVFYSISNCHAGLAGVSFGSFLIKQVAEDLKETVPSLKTFVTLSPVPGFAAWLAGLSPAGIEKLEANEKQAIAIVGESDWTASPAKVEAARPGLLSLAARYFLRAKRPDGRPVDPVARFHLGNGAMLNRIMHVGDISAGGLAQAHGLMVNYLYDLPRVEQRHEAFASEAEIAASRAVTSLLPGRGSAMKDVA